MSPTKEYYEDLLPNFRCTPEPKQAAESYLTKLLAEAKEVIKKVAESWGYETLTDPKLPEDDTTAENNSSAVVLATLDGEKWLFTADAGVTPLTAVAGYYELLGYQWNELKYYQIPHHGSRRNVGPTLLNRIIGPIVPKADRGGKTSYVCAAWDGGPKHPAKKVLNAFKRRGADWFWSQEEDPKNKGRGFTMCCSKGAPERGWTAMPIKPLFEEVDD
jgi:beta-lactamase superfamily II metal-dependent hydrolase